MVSSETIIYLLSYLLDHMIKTVLINPPLDTTSEGSYENWAPHLGLAYLGTSLLHDNFSCEIIDAKFDSLSLFDVMNDLKVIDPDVVGITMATEDYYLSTQLSKKIKEYNPELLLILGGPHPSAVPLRTLQEIPECDLK